MASASILRGYSLISMSSSASMFSWQKPSFYMFTAIYIKEPSAVCPLPWTLGAPNSRPMVFLDRTAHDLCRPIRGHQDVTSLWRARNLFWLTMGLAPSTLKSHITQLIPTQLQAY